MPRLACTSRLPRSLVPLLLLAGGAACSDPATPSSLPTLEVVRAPETGLPGEELAELVVLRAVDDQGRPLEGVQVTWSADADGQVSPLTPVTGLDGLIAARWRLGGVATRQTLRASVHDAPAIAVMVDAPVFTAQQVDAGFRFGCAIADQALWCFGAGYPMEQLTDQPRQGLQPVPVLPGVAVRTLAVADVSVCVVELEGAVRCAGAGFATAQSGGTLIPGLPPVIAIAAGDTWYCAVGSDGSVWCWRQVGELARVASATRFRTVTVGGGAWFGCGLDEDGVAWCWGSGEMGQLGHGLFESSVTPVPVSGALAFHTLSAGSQHACGSVGAAIYCWGDNYTLALTPMEPAVAVPTLRGEIRGTVHAGSFGGMALSAGTTVVWDFFEGLQRLQDQPGFAQLVFRDASADDSACGLTPEEAVYCITISSNDPPGAWRGIPPAGN